MEVCFLRKAYPNSFCVQSLQAALQEEARVAIILLYVQFAVGKKFCWLEGSDHD